MSTKGQLNGHRFPINGQNHHYDFDLLPFPAEKLRLGDNIFAIESDTEHHVLEVLWPGPALILKYRDANSKGKP